MELLNKNIAFLGDSITEGYGATDRYGYVDYFREYSGANCVNCGIAGTRIAKQKSITWDHPTFDEDFCKRAREMKGEFDFIIVFGGTNDYGHGDADFGTFGNRTSDTFYGALHTLYRTLIEKYPTTEIVVITPIHRADEDVVKNAVTGLYLKSYIDAIREVAEYYSLPVLDLYKYSGIQPNIPVVRETFVKDGLHPTDLGHQRIARKIIKYLENNF